MNFYQNYVRLCNQLGKSPSRVAIEIGSSKAAVNRWKNGSMPTDATLQKLVEHFGVSINELTGEYMPPTVTDDIVTFPVLGEVAASYGHIAIQEFTGETVDIPKAWLKGRNREDYFTLRISGDSMYPMYQDGDIVLVLKQSTMDRSGQIGVVLYDDDCSTLKRVEYIMGEDWMRLSPINPNYPPVTIRGESLEHCKILGIPKYLVRRISD